jgi:hypothetical protein
MKILRGSLLVLVYVIFMRLQTFVWFTGCTTLRLSQINIAIEVEQE